MKKGAFRATLRLLHRAPANIDKTGSWSSASALATTASQSDSDVDYTWAETQTPCSVYIALGNHPAFQWCEQRHCPEPRTRSHLDHVVSEVPDEPSPPMFDIIKVYHLIILATE